LEKHAHSESELYPTLRAFLSLDFFARHLLEQTLDPFLAAM